MRLLWILIGSMLVAANLAAANIVFENARGGDDGVVSLAGGSDMQFDPEGEGGEGSLLAQIDDDDLACSGNGLLSVPGAGRSLVQIDITTGGSLVYYVDGEFSYDGNSGDMTISAPGLEVACVGSVLFNNGFE